MDGRLKKIAQSAAMFGGTVVAAGMAIKGVSDYFTNPEGGSQTLRGMMEATSVFHGQQGQQLRTGGGGALIPVPPPATLSGFGRDELEAEKRELKARARRALDRDDHAAHGAAGAHLALLQQLLDAMAELPELVHRGAPTAQLGERIDSLRAQLATHRAAAAPASTSVKRKVAASAAEDDDAAIRRAERRAELLEKQLERERKEHERKLREAKAPPARAVATDDDDDDDDDDEPEWQPPPSAGVEAAARRVRKEPPRYVAKPATRRGDEDTIAKAAKAAAPPATPGDRHDEAAAPAEPGGAVLQVEFDGQWYAATVEKRVPSGVRVRFDEDGSQTLVPNDEIASRARGAGVEELIAEAASDAAEAAEAAAPPPATPEPRAPSAVPTDEPATAPAPAPAPSGGLISELLAANVALCAYAPNPKREGSDSHARYALYCGAADAGEFIARGGSRGDLKYDLGKGFCAPADPTWAQRVREALGGATAADDDDGGGGAREAAAAEDTEPAGATAADAAKAGDEQPGDDDA